MRDASKLRSAKKKPPEAEAPGGSCFCIVDHVSDRQVTDFD